MPPECIYRGKKYIENLLVRHWLKKLKTQINEKIFHAHELEELMLLKCPYYSKQSIDSVSLYQNSKYFSQKWTILKFVENHKILNSHSNLEKEEQS